MDDNGHRDPSRVERALERLGARPTRVLDNGEVDFALGEIAGFAREREGRFRAAFFLETNPDPVSSQRWADAHKGTPYVDPQLIEVADGTVLRLLVELPFDATAEMQAAVEGVRHLAFAWSSRHEGGSTLVEVLGQAGIALPPLGATAMDAVLPYDRWAWGSRYVPPLLLYLFEPKVVASHLAEGPLFALSHAGHGVNSYGLNLVTTAPSGAVAAYVQHGYGGAYSDPVRDLVDINATYSKLHVLWRATKDAAPSRTRWLMVYSQFRGACGLLDLDVLGGADDSVDAFEAHESETALFEAAVGRLGLTDADFGSGGRVTW